MNRVQTWLIRAGTMAIALVNVALFRPENLDIHDSANVAGMLVGGLLTQAAVVSIVYGLHRLLRQPKRPVMVVAFWTLLVLTGVKVFTIYVPPRRFAKP